MRGSRIAREGRSSISNLGSEISDLKLQISEAWPPHSLQGGRSAATNATIKRWPAHSIQLGRFFPVLVQRGQRGLLVGHFGLDVAHARAAAQHVGVHKR